MEGGIGHNKKCGIGSAWVGCMHKLTLPLSLMALAIAAIIMKVRAFYESVAPVGYQDENGFHVGEKPSEQKWPPFW